MKIIDDNNPENAPRLKKMFRRGERFAVSGVLFSISDISNRQLVAKAVGRYEKNRIIALAPRLLGPDGKPVR